jgi:transposase-like protein
MDCIPALEEVFKEEFPKPGVQRCTVHLTRNVLAKVPKKLKGQVASELKAIFYAPSVK